MINLGGFWIESNLPVNVLDIVRALHDPMKLVINDVKIKFLFEPEEDCCADTKRKDHDNILSVYNVIIVFSLYKRKYLKFLIIF